MILKVNIPATKVFVLGMAVGSFITSVAASEYNRTARREAFEEAYRAIKNQENNQTFKQIMDHGFMKITKVDD